MFEAWEETKETPVLDPFKLRREVIWLNKKITIERKIVCYKEWYKNGIILMHDLLKDDGSIKTLVELETEHNFQIKVMDYNSLVDAIPFEWKRALKQMRIPAQAVSNQEQPYVTCNGRLMALGITSNRDIYWMLVTKKQTKPNCANKWCGLFNIDTEDWKMIFTLYASIKDTRVKY